MYGVFQSKCLHKVWELFVPYYTIPHGCIIILPNKNVCVKDGIDHPVHRRYSTKILSLPKIIAFKLLLSGTGGSSLQL